MKNSPLIIIQGRMASTRFPGKILKEFYENLTILDLQLANLKKSHLQIVLATSSNKNDDALEDWATKNRIPCFRGSEKNVLQRFVSCAVAFEAKQIIRVCSDNPFLQVKGMELLVKGLEEGMDYISYADLNDIPAIKKHWGLFAEGISYKALTNALDLTQQLSSGEFYQEHVTNYIYGHPSKFKTKLIPAPGEIIGRNDLRFTVDTSKDFENMQNLYCRLNQKNLPANLNNLIKTVDNSGGFLETMLEGINAYSK